LRRYHATGFFSCNSGDRRRFTGGKKVSLRLPLTIGEAGDETVAVRGRLLSHKLER
jgi:hypothetical protein